MRAPAALLAVPLIIGATGGLLAADHVPRMFELHAAVAALLALAAAANYVDEGSAPEATVALLIGAVLAGGSLGLSAARGAYHAPVAEWFAGEPAPMREEPVEVHGCLGEDAALAEYGASLTIDVAGVRRLDERDVRPISGGVRLVVGGAVEAERLLAWRAGRTVVAPALLRVPAAYRNPGVPDDRRALARRGVALVGTIKSSSLVEVRARAGAIAEAAAAIRAWARRILARHVGAWSGPSGGVATAILIGDRTGLSTEDERRLQRAGTYHVIAISGGNIAILAALLLGLARLARLPGRTAAVLAIATLLFYGVLAGGGASVSRAVTAAVIYLAARVLDHRGAPMNALAVAAACAIASSALAPLDAGFILSFGATLAILLGTAHLLRSIPRSSSLPARAAFVCAALFAATLCAEIALAPSGAVLFSRITFAGLILNFAAIPLMTVVQAGGLLTLAVSAAWPAGASAAGYVTHLAATGLLRSAHFVDVFPWLSQDVPPPAWWLVSVYYAACAAAVWLPRHRRRALAAVILALALVIAAPRFAVRTPLVPAGRGVLRVVFVDVGQGDATAILLPDRRAMLVDAGGASAGGFDAGARIVAPSLRSLGVRRLDSLVVTHADPDHVGGALSILGAFQPLAVWEGVPVPPDPVMKSLAALHRRAWHVVQAGDLQRDGDVSVRVLHPPVPDWERQRVRNDDSVVLEIRLGDVSIVLPGDIERAAEREVLPRLGDLAPLVVLKAPHHGSATSSSVPFLEAVNPAAVVFSAGQENRFGHPAPVVVERYARRGAVMFSTAEDGAVICDTDGRRVELRGWASGRRVVLER